jgi:hypothetical protein
MFGLPDSQSSAVRRVGSLETSSRVRGTVQDSFITPPAQGAESSTLRAIRHDQEGWDKLCPNDTPQGVARPPQSVTQAHCHRSSAKQKESCPGRSRGSGM